MGFRIPEKMRLYKIPAETICKLRDFTFKRSLNGKQTYVEFKRTKLYLQAENTAICVNNEDKLYDEMYFPEELDNLPVIGIISKPDGMLVINLLCSNWNDRYESDWVTEIYK